MSNLPVLYDPQRQRDAEQRSDAKAREDYYSDDYDTLTPPLGTLRTNRKLNVALVGIIAADVGIWILCGLVFLYGPMVLEALFVVQETV